jgi:hypothetical protein
MSLKGTDSALREVRLPQEFCTRHALSLGYPMMLPRNETDARLFVLKERVTTGHAQARYTLDGPIGLQQTLSQASCPNAR